MESVKTKYAELIFEILLSIPILIMFTFYRFDKMPMAYTYLLVGTYFGVKMILKKNYRH